MITLFRRIRQRLISSGSVTKYLLYALGEILLVVVGILIALQINNWNERVKEAQKEQQVIRSLISEMETNAPIITTCITEMKENMDSADSLQMILGPEDKDIRDEDIIRLIGSGIGSNDRCVMQTDVTDELRSSGNLNTLKNTELRRMVSQWNATYMELKKEEDEWGDEFSNMTAAYLNEWISWDDVDKYFNQDDPDYLSSPFDYDPGLVLKEFEFANIVNMNYWRMSRINDGIEELSGITTRLLEKLREEYDG